MHIIILFLDWGKKDLSNQHIIAKIIIFNPKNSIQGNLFEFSVLIPKLYISI